MNPRALTAISRIVFVAALMWGILLASRKPLWHDEIVSLLYNNAWSTYGEILSGNTGPYREGNVFPAFYVSQKLLTDLTQYQPDVHFIESIYRANPGRNRADTNFKEWGDHQFPWGYNNVEAQVKARLSAILFMALFFACGFWYCTRWFGWRGGALFLAQALTAHLVIHHWAEARPYGLWMWLTLLQTCFLVELTRGRQNFPAIAFTQILLALTTIQAAPQVLLFSFLFTLWGGTSWRSGRQWLLTGLPLVFFAFYFLQSRRMGFGYFIAGSPWDLVLANFPVERWPWLLVAVAFAWRSKRELRPLVIFASVLLAFAWVLVIRYWIFPAADENHGGEFANRYLAYLTPIGLLLATYLPFQLAERLPGLRWRQALWTAVILLVLARAYKAVGLYLFFYPG